MHDFGLLTGTVAGCERRRALGYSAAPQPDFAAHVSLPLVAGRCAAIRLWLHGSTHGARPMKPWSQLRPLLPWLAFLLAFYCGWALLLQSLPWAVVAAHWSTALTMAFGSFVAGATPMGGGTVAFPVLVLGFGLPPELGRDFSFAVQSIGMVSASLFILCRRQPVEWPMLLPALAGSAIGTPLGVLLLAPLVPSLWIKLGFALLWASFGLLHVLRLRELAAPHGPLPDWPRFDRLAGFAVGLLGGATAVAVTGVGVDMLIYMVLVLLRQADLRIAIPTSVLLMAFNSALGLGLKLAIGDLQPAVFPHWLAAAPVVALGAPLGVFVVNKVGRKPALLAVALLCLLQFVWTLWESRFLLGAGGAAMAMVAVLAINLVFEWARRLGEAWRARDPQR